MTALLLVEDAWDPEAEVVVSARAAAETGSRAGLRVGETLAAGELFKAMLVASANDACFALAERAGPGISKFVARMNERARAMGLTATGFANPAATTIKQRSSARPAPDRRDGDGRTRNQAWFRCAGDDRDAEGPEDLREDRESAWEGRWSVRDRRVHRGAGKCRIARPMGTNVLIVLLNAPDRWWTAAGLLEAAFDEAHPKP
jgi:D-alanyl-D-alanine carboxypeptidase (penicillin-binding protein 5/6)